MTSTFDTGAVDDTRGRSIVGYLATVPLLRGIPRAELEELALVLRRREVPAGEVLWREGDEAHAMLLLIDGRVSVSVRLLGGRTVEVTTVGPGEVLGEIPLVDGGRHSAGARAVEPTTLLSLSRADFAALVSGHHPTAFTLRRRIANVGCTRLRRQLATLAASLDPPGGRPALDASRAELEFCGPPDSRYVRRFAAFRELDTLAVWGFLTAGRFARCASRRTVVAEGAVSSACYLTINGAVEKIIVGGGRRIRVGLAGPGQAFGYEGLIDGAPSPVTAATRERTLMLVLPHEAFERLFNGETNVSRCFLDVLNRDLMASLRQALRPQARLASTF